MIPFNFSLVFVTALTPLMVGSIWYHPKVWGTAWARVANVTESQIKNSQMWVIFLLTYIFGVAASFILSYSVIHQAHIYSLLAGDPGFGDPASEVGQYLQAFMDAHGQKFRTFRHGMLHGGMTGLLLATPVIGINALFERRSFTYILIHAGFWVLCLVLMGGILCQWM
jgi:hypothetical protein